MVGRSPYLQPVHLDLPRAATGRLVDSLIVERHPHSLAGVAVAPPAAASSRPGDRLACA
jgi:hypothetical protein